MKRFGQGGFATLEVILMVTVIGILASIAVPRFTDITARANTAKVQADLTTIDTAIAVYQMNNSSDPADMKALKDYLNDADILKPPSGNVFVEGALTPVSDTDYEIGSIEGVTRATLNGNTAAQFYYSANSSDSN